ncbi:MAG: hypothetical protein ACOYXN_02630 [Acidobacteriota bacterium]
MITGINETFPHEGVEYHLQIEDLDRERVLEARVYVGGRILFQRRQEYGSLREDPAGPGIEEKVREEMERLRALVCAAIVRGRIRA